MGLLKAAMEVTRRVLLDIKTFGGLVSSLLGFLSDLLGRKLVAPSWVWWLLGAILLFTTAWRAQWKLLKAEDRSRVSFLDKVSRPKNHKECC